MKANRSLSRLGRAAKRAMMFSLVAGSAVSLSAATTNAPSLLPAKPKWLKEASMTVKESYDDNVFLSDYDNVRVAPVSGSVSAAPNKHSWVTTMSPKLIVDFAPMISSDPEDLVRSLTLGYVPEFARYHDVKSESYSAERVATGMKLKCGDVTLTGDNLFTYIDGSDFGPSYKNQGGRYNAFMNSAVRERREQVQDKANVALQYDMDCWFLRGVGMLQNVNMLTESINDTNYVNYVDRYDRNFGGDLGYKVTTNFALTLGYRVGEQHQARLPAGMNQRSASSEYQRLLFGMEGNPTKWLTAKVQAGPDFRDYSDSTAVKDSSPVAFYGDASLEAKVSSKDTVGLKYKQSRSVSSTGITATEESALELSYAHKLTDKLTALLGGRVAEADYRASVSQTRNDVDYQLSAGVRYAFTPNLSAELGYMAEVGRELANDTLLNKEARTFDRNVTSLSVTLKY